MRHAPALALVFVAAAQAAAAQDPFRWSGTVAAGGEVEVIGISADVEASAADGSRVEVTATGLRGGARIEVEEHGEGVTVCVVHAGMQRTGERRCSMRGEGGRHRDEVQVRVRVPASARFAATTVSGGIRATGLTGDVRARSVSGDVRVATRGIVRAASVSGDVRVEMGRLPQAGTLSLKTVSGDVEVTLPDDASAEVRLSTLSGAIDTDFPVQLNGRRSGRRGWEVQVGSRVRGTLGDGGSVLELETVSGDIRLRRGR